MIKTTTNSLRVKPLQIGPLTLKELIEVFDEVVASEELSNVISSTNRESKEDLMYPIAKRVDDSLKKRFENSYTALQRDTIKNIFDNNVDFKMLRKPETFVDSQVLDQFARIYKHGLEKYMKIEFPDYLESTSDYLAAYLPGCRYKNDYGIYFNVRTCMQVIKSKNPDLKLFITAVAVHEMFHAFTERMLEEEKCNHSHREESPSYCILEEAAADKEIDIWLNKVKGSYLQDEIDKVRNILLRSSLPGYGEYDKIDENGHRFVPYLIKNKKCLGRNDVNDIYTTPSFNSAFEQENLYDKADSLWNSLLDKVIEKDLPGVPFYFDLFN